MSSGAPGTPAAPVARAVLVAAGRSLRMGGRRKPLIELAGRTVVEHACAALAASSLVREIVVVAHDDDLETIRALRPTRPAFRKVSAVVPGGEERVDSVRCGAHAAAAEGIDLLCIHDAARPLVTPAAVERVLHAAARSGAALLALPVRDTLKHSPDGRLVDRTVDREDLWAAQTPQAFEARRFLEVLERAELEGIRATDDAALWERYVGPVTIVPGEVANEKITRPEDLELARAWLERRAVEARR